MIMKKLLLFVFAAIAFAACTQNDVEELSSNRVYLPDEISVGFENNDETRVQLYEGKSVWNAGDLVSVFYKTLDNLMWEFQGEDGDRTGLLKMIEGSVGKQKMSEVVVVYPYNQDYILGINNRSVEAKMPAKQEYRYESYDPASNLMIATSEGRDFVLRNTCGWLKIELTGDGQQVEKLTLRGNNGETVAGDVTIDWDSSKATFISNGTTDPDDTEVGGSLVFDEASYDKLELNCHSAVLSSEPTAFYFTLPEQHFVDGITVEVKCRGYKSMVLETSDVVAIKRNHIKPMAAVEFEAEEGEGSEIPNNEIWYTATEQIWPNYEWDFGITLINNYYDESTGEGILEFDGELTWIANWAFEYMASLTSITLPGSIREISSGAFLGCDNLNSILIPDGVEIINHQVLCGCYNLNELKLPENLKYIGYAAFYGCEKIKSVNIPSGIEEVYAEVFAGCDNLERFEGELVSEDGRCFVINERMYSFAPAGLKSYTIPTGINDITFRAFAYCSNLEEIIISDGVKTIEDEAFSGCNELRKVTIADSVYHIGYGAFIGCESLECFDYKYATEDGKCIIIDGEMLAFAGCGVESYIVPDDVTIIGDYTFTSLYTLTTITLPSSLEVLAGNAFAYCYNLTSVYCKATTPPSLYGTDVFYDNASDRLIYVPVESLDAYLNAEGWRYYADAIVGYDFETGEVFPGDTDDSESELTFDISVTDIESMRAAIKIVPSNNTETFCWICGQWDGEATAEELMNQFVGQWGSWMNNGAMIYQGVQDYTGGPDSPRKYELDAPDTDYYVLAFGYAGGITTAPEMVTFRTLPAADTMEVEFSMVASNITPYSTDIAITVSDESVYYTFRVVSSEDFNEEELVASHNDDFDYLLEMACQFDSTATVASVLSQYYWNGNQSSTATGLYPETELLGVIFALDIKTGHVARVIKFENLATTPALGAVTPSIELVGYYSGDEEAGTIFGQQAATQGKAITVVRYDNLDNAHMLYITMEEGDCTSADIYPDTDLWAMTMGYWSRSDVHVPYTFYLVDWNTEMTALAYATDSTGQPAAISRLLTEATTENKSPINELKTLYNSLFASTYAFNKASVVVGEPRQNKGTTHSTIQVKTENNMKIYTK